MTVNEKKQQYLQDLPIADKIGMSVQLTREDVLSEEGLILVQCMARDGMYEKDIAEKLGIKFQTFWAWKNKYPELKQALTMGKELVDYKVENALLKSALGYKTTTVKTIINNNPDKNGNREVKIEKTETEVGPNTTACLAWLNNRKPEQWRRNRDNIAEYEDKKSGITINIVKGQPDEQSTEDDNWDAE